MIIEKLAISCSSKKVSSEKIEKWLLIMEQCNYEISTPLILIKKNYCPGI